MGPKEIRILNLIPFLSCLLLVVPFIIIIIRCVSRALYLFRRPPVIAYFCLFSSPHLSSFLSVIFHFCLVFLFSQTFLSWFLILVVVSE